MSFEIEKGKPIPSNRHDNPFPFEKMIVGDSFVVSPGEMKPGTVSSRVASFNKRNPAMKFITRQVNRRGRGKTTRVWRVV